MNKVIITDINYGDENTLTCLCDDVYTVINFSNMSDLVKEIVFRTCRIDNLEVGFEGGGIEVIDGYFVPTENKKLNKTNINIKQYVDIYIMTTKSELFELQNKLISKNLRVNQIKSMNINEVLPCILHVNYKINGD